MRRDREHSSSTSCCTDFLVGLFNSGPFFNDDDGNGNHGTGAKDNKSLCLLDSTLRVWVGGYRMRHQGE